MKTSPDTHPAARGYPPGQASRSALATELGLASAPAQFATPAAASDDDAGVHPDVAPAAATSTWALTMRQSVPTTGAFGTVALLDDNRLAVSESLKRLGWDQTSEIVTFADVTGRRVWLTTPIRHACDCDHCEAPPLPAPGPAFTKVTQGVKAQSKGRLKLTSGITSVLGVHPGTAVLLAVLPDAAAVLLTAFEPTLAPLLADLELAAPTDTAPHHEKDLT